LLGSEGQAPAVRPKSQNAQSGQGVAGQEIVGAARNSGELLDIKAGQGGGGAF
jgi:hypothetical protein